MIRQMALPEHCSKDDDKIMIKNVKDIFRQEAAAINNIPITGSFENAIQLIHKQVHQKRGKLVSSGMGTWELFNLMMFCCLFPIRARRARFLN